MTPDREQREQIQQDAEYGRELYGRRPPGEIGVVPWETFDVLARHCLALLDALEQAERERDELRGALSGAIENVENTYAARLSAVPALVEAAEIALREWEAWVDSELEGTRAHGLETAEIARHREAITAYQEASK